MDACLETLEGFKPQCVIGLGGGSPIDIAKTVAVMLANTGCIADYCGIDLVPKAGVPAIMVPTTAGTGSEVTPIAILSDEQEKLKKGVVSPHLFPKVALLDPELTLGLPPSHHRGNRHGRPHPRHRGLHQRERKRHDRHAGAKGD